MSLRVIIFGATGMVGEGVLKKALGHDDVESVLVVGRRPCGMTHPKLRERIHTDFHDYSTIEADLKGWNACFFCLGVSSVGMNEEGYRRITYDLTMQAARTLSRLNPEITFCYVSGTGTDSTEKGRLMWARVKGKTENDLRKLPFKTVYAFRPGLMKPVTGQQRVKWFFRLAAWPYPAWRLLFPGSVCTLEDLGLAMIRTATDGYSSPVLGNLDITNLAQSKKST